MAEIQESITDRLYNSYNEFGVGIELSKDLKNKVVNHRDTFFNFQINKYFEQLITLFSYKNTPVTLNNIYIEGMLRQGYSVAIGKNIYEKDVVLGYIATNNTTSDIDIGVLPLGSFKPLNKKDINFLIPKKEQKLHYEEITENNLDGNFIVLTNKLFNDFSDYSILQHYVSELAELEASKFSLIIQSKVMTVFVSDIGDETTNTIINDLYNGSPVLKTDQFFDEDSIKSIDNGNLTSTLNEIEHTRQATLAQLNALFGINVSDVNKESGVSDSELNSNISYVNNVLNTYIQTRNKKLSLYNAKYGTDYRVVLNGWYVNE